MPVNKHTLNDIISNFQNIELKLIDSEGELTEEIESLLISNDADLSEKLDGYEKFVRYLKGQIDFLKNLEEQYSYRRKVIENSIKRSKERMLNAMIITGKNKIKTAEFNFSINESEKWIVDEDQLDLEKKTELIENGLAKNIFKLSISQIKDKYKNEEIPEWINVEKNKHLRVK
tara:strand:- start:134 stop:655 length:522 start_codon:yes stop_codon:yes gene_type:complete